jgi:hypothetical protein
MDNQSWYCSITVEPPALDDVGQSPRARLPAAADVGQVPHSSSMAATMPETTRAALGVGMTAFDSDLTAWNHNMRATMTSRTKASIWLAVVVQICACPPAHPASLGDTNNAA